MRFIHCYILLINLLSLAAYGQVGRADSYFHEKEYQKASELYQKAYLKDTTNTYILKQLAHSLHHAKDFNKAITFYSKALQIDSNDAELFLHRGRTFKANNNNSFAKQDFIAYKQRNPSKGFLTNALIESCDEIKKWNTLEAAFSITTPQKINSKNNEFCPVIWKDYFFFTSDKSFDVVNQIAPSNSRRKLQIYVKNLKTGVTSPILFKEGLDAQIGPMSISEDGSTIYYCVTKRQNSNSKNKQSIQLYEAAFNIENKKVGKGKLLPFNDLSHNCVHPHIMENTLYFSSNMKGGFGQMDIYKAIKDTVTQTWGAPINLGSRINTSENDVFPFYTRNALYFSSRGHAGYGNLDIFKATLNDENTVIFIENLRSPVNSNSDDFGFSPISDTTGYFTSNRTNGMGGDDIYFYTSNVLAQQEIKGRVLFANIANNNPPIVLLDENDNPVDTTNIDQNGNFHFDGIYDNGNYTVQLLELDDSQLSQIQVFLTNTDISETKIFSNGNKLPFVMSKLEGGGHQFFALNISDESTFKSVKGIIFNKLKGDSIAGKEIWLVDDEGNIIQKTTTNAEGKFVFRKLYADGNYEIQIPTEDVDDDLTIGLENPDPSQPYVELDSTNSFGFSNKAEKGHNIYTPQDSSRRIKGLIFNKLKGDTIGAKEVWLVDEDGNIIEKVTTDKQGKFIFKKLVGSENYSIQLAEEDDATPLTIAIENQNENAPALVVLDKEEKFRFGTIDGEESFSTLDAVNDRKRKAMKGILFNKLKGDTLNAKEVWLVDDDGNVIEKVTTDEQGRFYFKKLSGDKEYSIVLPEEDIDVAISIINEDNSTTNLETDQPFSIDKDSLKKQQLETLAGFIQGDTVSGKEVLLIDDKGNILERVITNKEGKFYFKKIPAEGTYFVELPLEDENNTIHIAVDGKTEKYVQLDDSKTFKFKKLKGDNVELDLLDEEDIALKIYQLKGKVHNNNFTKKTDLTAAKVVLKNQNNQTIASSIPNKDGHFSFSRIMYDGQYSVVLEKPDTNITIFLSSLINNKTLLTKIREHGKFKYNKIKIDEYSIAALDTSSFDKTIAVSGQLFTKMGMLPSQDKEIWLMDERDNIIQKILAGKNGRFKFDKLPADQIYSIHIPENDDVSHILILDKNNNPTKKITTLKGENYLLKEIDENNILVNLLGLVYINKPGDLKKSIAVTIQTNSTQDPITTYTDSQGRFVFDKIKTYKHVRIKVNHPEALRITLLNEDQDTIRHLSMQNDGFYHFPSNTTLMDNQTNESDTLDVVLDNTFMLKNVYFELNSSTLSKEAQNDLQPILSFLKNNPNSELEISAHTDSRATKGYNLKLSQDRANSTKNFFVRNNIDKWRVSALSYGESRPLNNCTDNVPCSEKEHAANRRVEFKLISHNK